MPHHDDHSDTPGLTRRDAVRRLMAAGLAFGSLTALAACSSGGSSRTRGRHHHDLASMPDPEWPAPRTLNLDRTTRHDTGAYRVLEQPKPTINLALPNGVRARDNWAAGDPVPSLMDKMTPIKRITVHHDGMTVFNSTAASAAQSRIEAIRAAHRGRGWGDIGYHYAIDPAGRVWEGRPLSWQGSHVRAQNPGNVGICVLGNYEEQRPTQTQLTKLEGFVEMLMRRHNVTLAEVHTHRELAATACPGRYLQPRVVAMRGNSGLLARV